MLEAWDLKHAKQRLYLYACTSGLLKTTILCRIKFQPTRSRAAFCETMTPFILHAACDSRSFTSEKFEAQWRSEISTTKLAGFGRKIQRTSHQKTGVVPKKLRGMDHHPLSFSRLWYHSVIAALFLARRWCGPSFQAILQRYFLRKLDEFGRKDRRFGVKHRFSSGVDNRLQRFIQDCVCIWRGK